MAIGRSKRRRKRAAGDLADDFVVLQHGAALPRHAFAFDLQAHANRLRLVGCKSFERLAADELAAARFTAKLSPA